MSDTASELEESLRSLETLAERRQAPSRYDARRLLLALGTAILEQGRPPGEELLGRLKPCLGSFGRAWEEALTQEIELACSEHVLGVDPRFLEHPRFDFEYVLAARERLEARFQALRALGTEVPEAWAARVREADQRLAPFLEGPQGGSEGPGEGPGEADS